MTDSYGDEDDRRFAADQAALTRSRRAGRWSLAGVSALATMLLATAAIGLASSTLQGCSVGVCADECIDDPGELVAAATAGDNETVATLVEAASAQEASDAAWCALRFRHLETAELAIEAGGSSDRTIDAAARHGYVELIDAALRAGADPQDVLDAVAGLPTGGVQLCRQEGPGLVGTASVDAGRAMVELAVLAGADPNGRPAALAEVTPGTSVPPVGEGSMSPLLRAAYLERVGAVQGLLDAGADPNAGGLVDWFFVVMAQALLGQPSRAGSALPRISSKGPVEDVTPLIGAATAGNSEIVAMLLRTGADPNVAADGRFVALHAAAARGDAAMAFLLLDAGADPSPPVLVLQGGPMPSDVARAYGHDGVAELIDRAADERGGS